MRRVLVIGPPGAGKSTLSRALGGCVGLPVVHLDQLLWQPGWVQRGRAEFDVLLAEAMGATGWIIDGNFVRTLPARLAAADTVIWLDFPRWICFGRVLWRTLANHGHTRIDMAPDCPERFDLEFLRYIWSFRLKERPLVATAIETHGRHCNLQHLRSPAAARRFLSTLT